MIILLGVGLQLLQLFLSIKNRNQNRDLTGDPWNGRTLEWSTPSPAPYYNFAIEPQVTERDEYWHWKETGNQPSQAFKPFHLPKNSPFGLLIAFAGFIVCFSIVWHIWWMLVVSFVAMIVLILLRFSDEDTEYEVTREMVALEESRS